MNRGEENHTAWFYIRASLPPSPIPRRFSPPFSFNYNEIFFSYTFRDKSSPVTKIMSKKVRWFRVCIFTLSSGWLKFHSGSHSCACNTQTHRVLSTQSLLLLSSQNLVAQVIFPCTVKWFKVFIPRVESETRYMQGKIHCFLGQRSDPRDVEKRNEHLMLWILNNKLNATS